MRSGGGSRGRADAVVVPPPVQLVSTEDETVVERGSALNSLRSELTALHLKELRARAKAEGIVAELLDGAAADSDDPKSAVIELLVNVASEADAAHLELSGLRLKELRDRAKDAGHSAALLEEAADSDDPKAAVVALLLSSVPRATQQSEPEPSPSPAPRRTAAVD